MFDERHAGLGAAPAYDNEFNESIKTEAEAVDQPDSSNEIAYESMEGQLQAAKVYLESYIGSRQKIDVLSRAIVSARETALGSFSESPSAIRVSLEERFKKLYEKNVDQIQSFDYATLSDPNTETPFMDFVHEISEVYEGLQVVASQASEVGTAVKQKVLLEVVNIPSLSKSLLPGTPTSQQVRDIVAYYSEHQSPENDEKAKLFSRFLVFEENFENNLKHLFTENDIGKVDSSVFQDIQNEAIESKPEKLDGNDKPVYFPVGISKDMDKWQKVLAGEGKVERPIDMYAYLLWLNQLGEDVTLVVCDEAQVPNYTTKFGVSEAEAKNIAQRIGEADRQHYETVIKTLNLEHIKVVNYAEFIDSNKDSFKEWQEVTQKLADGDLFAEACKGMSQMSVDFNTSDEEKRKYLNYALEELATILSTDGLKVSHQKEARYDGIAMVLQGITSKLSENGTITPSAIFADTNSRKFIEVFDEVVRGLQIKVKSIQPSNKDQKAYYAGIENVLNKLLVSLKNNLNNLGFDKEAKQKLFGRGKLYEAYAKQVKLDYIVPSVGSRSIGRKTVKGGGVTDVVSHKEPYAAYFPSELSFFESDQVLASLEGSAVGKVMALSHEKQMEYFEDAVKPLIIRFIAQLPNLPEQYFDDLEVSRNMIIRDCKNIASVSESIYFVQKYIQRAVAIEKKYGS